MHEWSMDITAAPRGKTVHSERKVGDRIHQISDFIPDYIWAATQCDKVIKSYWIPPAGKNAGRWSGFANGEQPIAWQHFVVPEHPFQESPRKAAEAVAERPASTGATVASGLVEADKAEAVAGGSGQPELIPALTAQHGGVNVDGPERAGVTGGESAATSFRVSGFSCGI